MKKMLACLLLVGAGPWTAGWARAQPAEAAAPAARLSNNSYDSADCRKRQPEHGAVADFDALLKGMHQRGLKLVMNAVINRPSAG